MFPKKDDDRSFKGFLHDEELKFLAIDNFTDECRKCKVFLLSHHHTDHMQGLNSFVSELHQSSNKHIYTSTLTALYLENNYGIDPKKIESLPFHKSFVVHTLDDGNDVTVTCTPAGHCPGSVMFVIEYRNKKILYTGDFRMNLSEFKESQKYLIKSNGRCREIDSLYIDSTFAFPNKMPHRDQSQDVILKLAEEWLMDVTSNNKIIIDIHTCIGSEYLFVSLSKQFKTQIAVHADEFVKFYNAIGELRSYFKIIKDISKENDWLIHACRTSRTACHEKLGNFRIRLIRPCALRFFQKNLSNQKYINGVPYIENKLNSGSLRSNVRIYYSHHSSLEELQDIVQFIAPKRLYLNTVYIGREKEMRTALLGSEPKTTPKEFAFTGVDVKNEGIRSLSKEEYELRKRRRKSLLNNLNLLDD